MGATKCGSCGLGPGAGRARESSPHPCEVLTWGPAGVPAGRRLGVGGVGSSGGEVDVGGSRPGAAELVFWDAECVTSWVTWW